VVKLSTGMRAVNINFSAFNVEYFFALREIARDNPVVATALFGASPSFLEPVSRLSPHQLACLSHITVPLVVPRHEPVWWARLLEALSEGNRTAVIALSEEASYYFIHQNCVTPPRRSEDTPKGAATKALSKALGS
jgi:hypothetical protein